MAELLDTPIAVLNQALVEKFTSKNQTMVKEAEDALNDYTRVQMREDGFWRRVLPPVTITAADLHKQVDTDKPVRIVSLEPDSPGAISIPFATLPMNRYINGRKYRVMFDRLTTRRLTKDVATLLTYDDIDIRQVMSDNSIKDMLAEEDGKAMVMLTSLLVAAGTVLPETGIAQWVELTGGITRDSLMESMKIMTRANRRLQPATALINNVTIWDIAKLTRNEAGGDISQKWLQNGYSEEGLLGLRWIVTIKRDLVPDGTVFLFAAPKFLGKFFVLEDTTMYVDRKAYMLEFFSYESIGSCIGNVAGVVRVDFKA